MTRLNVAVNAALGKLGAFVASHSVAVLIAALCIALGLTAGMIRLPEMQETAADKLWIPSSSRWLRYDDLIAPRLGSGNRQLQLIWQAPAGAPLLSVDTVREMFATQQQIYELPITYGGEVYTWRDICWKDARGMCRTTGVLSFFGDDPATFEAVAARGEAAFRAALSSDSYPSGQPAGSRAFYKPTRGGQGRVLDAELAYWGSSIAPSADSGLVEEATFALEDLLTGAAFGRSLKRTRVFFDMPNSIDNAIGESVGGDAPFIAVAVAVICAFVVLALFVRDCVFTRTSLAFCGIASVCLSISATFGFSVLIGIPFTSLSQILPFILLGIGVDDLFVLVRSLEEVDERFGGLDTRERFRRALEHGGMSITTTTATNVAAFLFGSLTTIPAVRWFCWTAALGIFFDWALQVTFFVACFALTERRIEAGRYDCACCWKRAPAATLEAANRHVTTASGGSPRSVRTAFPLAPWQAVRAAEARAERVLQNEQEASNALPPAGDGANGKELSGAHRGASTLSNAKLPVGFLSASKDSYLQIFLNRFLVPPLLHPVGRALVILVFLGIVATGAVGASRLDEGLDLSTLAPNGHYTKDYYQRDNLFLSASGYGTRAVIAGVDQSDPAVQRRMLASVDTLLDGYAYFSRAASPAQSWLTAFHDFVAEAVPADANEDGTVAQANFYSHLGDFLSQQPVWRDDIALTGSEPAVIDVSTFAVVHTPDASVSGAYERKVLTETMAAIDTINAQLWAAENAARSGSEPVFYVQAAYYKYWETSRIIFRELALNLGLALLGVALISAALLIAPAAVLLVMAAVVSVDLFLFAEMWLAGIPVNTVSVVNLVMAVGLSVDYSLHVMHTFLATRGASRGARVRGTMLGIAAAVLLAVLSTFFGALALAGTTSEIIRTLFALLLGTVLSGGFVGLLVLPAVLSLIGPGPELAPAETALAPAGAAAAEPAPSQQPVTEP